MRKWIPVLLLAAVAIFTLTACGGGAAPAGQVVSITHDPDQGFSYSLMVGEGENADAFIYATATVADATSLSGTRTDGATFYVPPNLVAKAESLNGKSMCGRAVTSTHGADFDITDLWAAPAGGCH